MNQKTLDVLKAHEDFMTMKWNDDLLLTGGTAHIVYDDYNTSDADIEFCREYTQRFIDNPDDSGVPAYFSHYSSEDCQEILQDTLRLLDELLEIPEEERYVWEEEDFAVSEEEKLENFGRTVDVIVDQVTGESRIVIYHILGTSPDDAFLQPLRIWKNVSLYSLRRMVNYLLRSGGISVGDKEKMDMYIQEQFNAKDDSGLILH